VPAKAQAFSVLEISSKIAGIAAARPPAQLPRAKLPTRRRARHTLTEDAQALCEGIGRCDQRFPVSIQFQQPKVSAATTQKEQTDPRLASSEAKNLRERFR